jgi:hypothetical protein
LTSDCSAKVQHFVFGENFYQLFYSHISFFACDCYGAINLVCWIRMKIHAGPSRLAAISLQKVDSLIALVDVREAKKVSAT